MKVLTVTTVFPELRSECIGWTCEDSNEVQRACDYYNGNVRNIDVGSILTARGSYSYDTVLHAVGDGWKLLGPPSKIGDKEFEWWLTKD